MFPHGYQISAGIIITILLELAVLIRIMLRPHRDPAARIAWVLVVAMFPLVGILAYLLVGEVRIGRRRMTRLRTFAAHMHQLSDPAAAQASSFTAVPEHHRHLFQLGHSISGFAPVAGNRAQLLADSNAAIDAMVSDIDAATDHVHLLFYIWLADNNGRKVIDALKRAASRGVTCRAMADDLGSRALIRSAHWQAMREAGVHVAAALPIGNPFLRPLTGPFLGRIDVRNHRKILVIDHQITYCGSQNCADPEFRPKAKFAPWVDAMIRFEGPIAHQNQILFASDWMTSVNENLEPFLRMPPPGTAVGLPAQVIATGPTMRYSAMPEIFESLMFAARREIIISTPYYVPDESLQGALCTTARRGVDTTIIFPARNDSRIVAAASRSYYSELLGAGVNIHEYAGGLLHTKSVTVDAEITLIGSANMDRRSFELNFENNILFHDRALTADVRQRQQAYLAKSERVTQQMVARWRMPRLLWNNTIATLGPVL